MESFAVTLRHLELESMYAFSCVRSQWLGALNFPIPEYNEEIMALKMSYLLKWKKLVGKRKEVHEIFEYLMASYRTSLWPLSVW
jgi:hypothetical protein